MFRSLSSLFMQNDVKPISFKQQLADKKLEALLQQKINIHTDTVSFYNKISDETTTFVFEVFENDGQQSLIIWNNNKEEIFIYLEYTTLELFTDLTFSDPLMFGNLILDLSRTGLKIANLESLCVNEQLTFEMPHCFAALILTVLIIENHHDGVIISAQNFTQENLLEMMRLLFDVPDIFNATLVQFGEDIKSVKLASRDIGSLEDFQNISRTSYKDIDYHNTTILLKKADVIELTSVN